MEGYKCSGGSEKRFGILCGIKSNVFTKFRTSDLVPSFEDFCSRLPRPWKSFSCKSWAKQEQLKEEFCDEGRSTPFYNETLEGSVTCSAVVELARHSNEELEILTPYLRFHS